MLMLYSSPDDKPDITLKLGVSKDHGTSMFWMAARVGNSFSVFEQGTLAIMHLEVAPKSVRPTNEAG
jgi:hypothetical protein